MSFKTKFKSSTGILTVATFSMALAACDQSAPTNGTDTAAAEEIDANCIVMADAKPNPCAADACNPCAANPCGGCNPCAANPCAANPCAANPCAANPCAANPCAANPCAANPCAANPCAAANPCGGCNPCNPCAGDASANGKSLSAEEKEASYECSKEAMSAGYAMSGNDTAKSYTGWARYNKAPYKSPTHGGRMVNNYANEIAAEEYGKFEEIAGMPVGAILAKDSIVFDKEGMPSAGPLFLMEKMPEGFMADYGDWKYTLIMPNGNVWGETLGKNSGGMQFCVDCHFAAEDFDYLFFMPEENRK